MSDKNMVEFFEHDSSQNMLSILNDHCLEHILEMCIGDMDGLYQLATVCTRFQYIIKQIFRTHCRRMRNYPAYETNMHVWQPQQRPLQLLQRFYRIFGEFMIGVESKKRIDCDKVNEIIAKYCTHLESFSCELKNEETRSGEIIEPIAQRVKRLDIEWNHMTSLDLSGTLNQCPYLELLTIRYCDFFNPHATVILPATKISNMAELQLWNMIYTSNLGNFMKQNNQLKRINLNRIDHVDHILKSLPNLEFLSLEWVTCDDFDCFGQLKKLKELEFQDDNTLSIDVLNAIVRHGIELESLLIYQSYYYTSAGNYNYQLKCLKCLHLICSGDDYDFSRYVREFPALIELKVDWPNIDFIIPTLEHAQDSLVKASFKIDVYPEEEQILMRKLEEIWLKAQRRNIILSVELLYPKHLDDKMRPLEEFQLKHRSWVSFDYC